MTSSADTAYLEIGSNPVFDNMEECILEERIFSGVSLEEALAKETLTQTGIELVGLVKSSEKKGYVCFTKAGCEHWVELPTEMIEQAVKVSETNSRDHLHPVMRITLKKPKSPEAQIFAALSSLSGSSQVEFGRELGGQRENNGFVDMLEETIHSAKKKVGRWKCFPLPRGGQFCILDSTGDVVILPGLSGYSR